MSRKLYKVINIKLYCEKYFDESNTKKVYTEVNIMMPFIQSVFIGFASGFFAMLILSFYRWVLKKYN